MGDFEEAKSFKSFCQQNIARKLICQLLLAKYCFKIIRKLICQLLLAKARDVTKFCQLLLAKASKCQQKLAELGLKLFIGYVQKARNGENCRENSKIDLSITFLQSGAHVIRESLQLRVRERFRIQVVLQSARCHLHSGTPRSATLNKMNDEQRRR